MVQDSGIDLSHTSVRGLRLSLTILLCVLIAQLVLLAGDGVRLSANLALPMTPRVLGVLVPLLTAVVIAAVLTVHLVHGQSSSTQMLNVVSALMIVATVVTARGHEWLVLGVAAFGMVQIAATWSRRGAVVVLIGLTVALGMVVFITREVAAAVTVLLTGTTVTFARVASARVLADASENARLFRQARSAASTLSDVILRVEQTVHRARIHEMTKERRRVAREIHDSVGYTLTGLMVQLDVVRRLVENPEARERLQNLETIARQALQEVRKEVGALRAEIEENKVVSYRSRWIQVCEYFGECTGIRVDHEFTANLEGVSPEIGDAVYRVIQEALTNAYRHGEATLVDVSMSWREARGLILLRISDNGRGLDSLKPGNGLGGVRERVGLLSGSVVFQSQPGRGFDMGVDIPWSGPTVSRRAG
ncbi:MAG: sensor histidine kinase [Spirochaetaceae bacterium]|nr:MAG: sensor histidine kinase [Spirochaetaceae bacterium]